MSHQPLPRSQSDYTIIAPLASAIIAKAGGFQQLAIDLPRIFRTAIDEVIDAPRTGRFTLAETEKTEKTYLGTKIEILVRTYLGFPAGQVLDLSVGTVEMDIKNTTGQNWTLPPEAVGHPCLLNRLNEATAKCDVGIVVVKEDYLNPGQNRDAKRTLSQLGRHQIWWLLKDHPYPPNFWEVLPLRDRQQIVNAGGGTLRLAALFEKIQRRPISRVQVQALAQQHDYMKRIRRNGGARDVLAPKGIAILWGQGDKALIKELGLGPVGHDEFISYKPNDPEEIALLKRTSHID